MSDLWMDKYDAWDKQAKDHRSYSFQTRTLVDIERLLPSKVERSVETGCGKSTILFSNLSSDHTAFALDDRSYGNKSSVDFFLSCPLSVTENVKFVYGPTQKTLPTYDAHKPYDVILLDGPHGYPFPELEYLFLYPHLKKGGFLIIDDVQVPTIARLADLLIEDDMYAFVALIAGTALFRRTDAETFDPFGDGCWSQKYNRRRASPANRYFVNEGPVRNYFSDQQIDEKINGDWYRREGGP